MSSIKELLDEIETLDRKNKEWSRKKLKRKLQIEAEIERLNNEKTRAGLHHDPASVMVYNSQIKRLQHEKTADYDFEYLEKINVLKRKVTDVIADYYSNGYVIEDIFLKEEVPQNIQKEWLDKGDFGKNTGFVFVEIMEDDEGNNWRYMNPITDFELKSNSLNGLKSKIKYYNQIFLIFDNDLADKSKNDEKDLYKQIIDPKLDELDRLCFGYSKARKILEDLEKFADYFTDSQINRLCEISINNSQIYDCFVCTGALRNILDINRENIDSKLYGEVVLKNGF